MDNRDVFVTSAVTTFMMMHKLDREGSVTTHRKMSKLDPEGTAEILIMLLDYIVKVDSE